MINKFERHPVTVELSGGVNASNSSGTLGGKGKLLSRVPGVAPATVTIIGGGVVGLNAAKLAAGLGAKVSVSPDWPVIYKSEGAKAKYPELNYMELLK